MTVKYFASSDYGLTIVTFIFFAFICTASVKFLDGDYSHWAAE